MEKEAVGEGRRKGWASRGGEGNVGEVEVGGGV